MKWTADDLEILREIYPINPKYCAEILERDYKAVSVKASKLGISKNVRNTPENYTKKLLTLNVKPLSEFEGALIDALFECTLCGEHFCNRPHNVMYKASKCPNCGGKDNGVK